MDHIIGYFRFVLATPEKQQENEKPNPLLT